MDFMLTMTDRMLKVMNFMLKMLDFVLQSRAGLKEAVALDDGLA